MTEFISKERIFANATKLTEILLNSESYANFHERLSVSDLDYNENKTYEVAPSGFIDFNQHLYEDINHMNSISTGLYLEKSFITFNIELDVTPLEFKRDLILLLSSSDIARRIDSILTNSSFNFLLSSIESSNNFIVSWLKYSP